MWERTVYLPHFIAHNVYLEKNVCAHGLPMRDDGLLVLTFPIPAVQLNTSASQSHKALNPPSLC